MDGRVGALSASLAPPKAASALGLVLASVALHALLWLWLVPASAPDGALGSTLVEHPHHFQTPQAVVDTVGPSLAVLFPAVLLGSATNLGIFASILWEHSRLSEARLTRKSFAPFLISPLVLLFTYSSATAHPDLVVALLMAFQNGFFWQSVLGKMQAGRARKAKKA